MDGPMRVPLARSEGLVVEELGDELLIYDTDVKNVHCLTPTAARVWRACDGRTSTESIGARLGLSPLEVDRALTELDGSKLFNAPSSSNGGFSRRDFGLRVTKVAAATATLPLVLSIAAPAAAQSASVIAFCKSLVSPTTGTNDCGQCNQKTGNNTPCCCCHAPTKNYDGQSISLGSGKKLCAPKGDFCVEDLGGSHCTEGGSGNDPV